MLLNGVNYNFGRVVYLTLARLANAPDTDSEVLIDKDDVVTIAYDPKTNPNWVSRIDFYVRNVWQSNSGDPVFSIANIDLFNIGPALQQFMNAYNEYTKTGGKWKETQIQRYACCLQVGYAGGRRTTIFSGMISSYNVERIQTDVTVDTVWHLYCQYPGGNETLLEETKKATSGADYRAMAQQASSQAYMSPEERLKMAIMAERRQVYTLVPVETSEDAEIKLSFFTTVKKDESETQLTPLPSVRKITQENFDKYFEIRYKRIPGGKEYTDVKQMWQKRESFYDWNRNYESLSSAISEIAHAQNCYAYMSVDWSTGKQIIYIYPAGKPKLEADEKANFVIEDFQNLRRAPGVSGGTLQLDMLLEPGVRANDTFELKLSEGFKTRLQKSNTLPSFEPNMSGVSPNATTLFAGANFIGTHNTLSDAERKESAAQVGNVFNLKYIALFVVHQGSTHKAEWSTVVDCVNIEQDSTPEEKQPRGIRNNNPGNIRYTGTAWQGLANPPSDGEYCIFVSVQYGLRALAKLLRNYSTMGFKTISQIISRYAPAPENNTAAYINSVVKNTGYSANEQLNLADDNVLINLMKAIILQENGKQPYSTAEISAAISIV